MNARIQLGSGHDNAGFRVMHRVSRRLSLDPAQRQLGIFAFSPAVPSS
jgi:hypothetical protein